MKRTLRLLVAVALVAGFYAFTQDTPGTASAKQIAAETRPAQLAMTWNTNADGAKAKPVAALILVGDELELRLARVGDLFDAAKDKSNKAKGDDLVAAKKELDDLTKVRDTLVAQLKVVVAGLKTRDDAAAKRFGATLLGITGEVSMDDIAVVGTFAQIQLERMKKWAIESGPGLLGKAVGFLVILFVFRILSRVSAKVVHKGLQGRRLSVSDLLKNFMVNTVANTTFLVGLLIAISSIGVDIGPLLAAVSVAGFVIGFALQETMANFASGVMILLYRPYDIGDEVSAAGVSGRVDSMNLVSTVIYSVDHKKTIVPNGKIWGGVIVNGSVTKPPGTAAPVHKQ